MRYTDKKITATLEENYMPYAMSIIVSRALPEIDGFKPAHRKLLYTMYKMGLLNGALTKSAKVVGQVMQLNPHGDGAIYETLVRLSRGNGTLLVPFVQSKGNFGKVYSRDMAYAASRYTEAKLEPICAAVFGDIDQDAVDFVDNYDGTLKEPALLPTAFPNILVSANLGIAVSMASNICGFDLCEVCRTTIAYLKDPNCDLMLTLPGPDFSTGGEILFDPVQMTQIYETGRGSVKIRSVWNYIKKENLIEVTEIPYSTTIEAIIDKTVDLMKAGKLREISDIRDESGLAGMKITIELKRGTDPEALMRKLMKMTPLTDTFSCNFNILIGGVPRVMGVREILDEWCAWRTECVRRRTYFNKKKKEERLHLLLGLKKILLDIDKAIAIIRETENDAEVIPNLMIGFGIDELQAEFIAEIKLRNINKEYIIKRIKDVEDLQKEIADLESILASKTKLRNVIIKELEQIIKKYPTERKTKIVHGFTEEAEDEEEAVDDYPVNLFVTAGGYFKKITPLSLRMGGEQKFKEGDSMAHSFEAGNKDEIVFLTDKYQAYKARVRDFEDGKASQLGDYLPVKLGMEPGESPIFAFVPGDYKGSLVLIFANGKAARIELSCYDTKSNRKRLTGAYSDKSPLVAAFHIKEEKEICLYSGNRMLMMNTAALSPKTTRTTQGVAVMSLKKNAVVSRALDAAVSGVETPSRYRTKTLPAAGAILRQEDLPEKQLTLD